MAGRKFKTCLALLFSILLMVNAYANEAISLKLENNLPACLTFGKPSIYSAEGVLFAKIPYVQKDSTAACGCKSAVSTFTASAGKKENLVFLMSGNLIFAKARSVNFPLTMNQSFIPKKTVNLNISCAE